MEHVRHRRSLLGGDPVLVVQLGVPSRTKLICRGKPSRKRDGVGVEVNVGLSSLGSMQCQRGAFSTLANPSHPQVVIPSI